MKVTDCFWIRLNSSHTEVRERPCIIHIDNSTSQLGLEKKVGFLEKVFRFFRFLKVLKGFLRFLRLQIARQLALLYIALY